VIRYAQISAFMDLVKVLGQLREELANLDAAISSLERLYPEAGARKRGRPPKVLTELRKGAHTEHHTSDSQDT
jgi:hypothetical protein